MLTNLIMFTLSKLKGAQCLDRDKKLMLKVTFFWTFSNYALITFSTYLLGIQVSIILVEHIQLTDAIYRLGILLNLNVFKKMSAVLAMQNLQIYIVNSENQARRIFCFKALGVLRDCFSTIYIVCTYTINTLNV